MVGREKNPLSNAFGDKIGEMMAFKHTQHGVKLHMEQEVKEIVKNTQGAVEAVILKNGDKIPCNIVVVGMGVKPATEFVGRTNSMIS